MFYQATCKRTSRKAAIAKDDARIVWDRLPGHRSRLVQDYMAGLQGWITTAYPRPYAPELNPGEYIWGYWKQHELPNVCPEDHWQLSEAARGTLSRIRRRPRLITAF